MALRCAAGFRRIGWDAFFYQWPRGCRGGGWWSGFGGGEVWYGVVSWFRGFISDRSIASCSLMPKGNRERRRKGKSPYSVVLLLAATGL